jgi:hypothetical protein
MAARAVAQHVGLRLHRHFPFKPLVWHLTDVPLWKTESVKL